MNTNEILKRLKVMLSLEDKEEDKEKEEMKEGVPHFTKDGKLYEGPTHEMNGKLMTGATHTDESELLYHKEELEDKEEEEDNKKEAMKSLATLVDGTEVFVMDGDIAPGSILNVVTDNEEQLLAPEGVHETSDGLIVTVGEAGKIISVEPKVKSEDGDGYGDDDDKKKEEMSDVFLVAMAEILKPFIKDVKEINEEFNKIKQRFEAIAEAPASTKIKTKMSRTKEELDDVEKRIEILKSIKKQKK